MPTYELALIVRAALERPQLANCLKRTCTYILDRGGVVRQMENLGNKNLPYIISSHGHRHTEGNYFTVDFDLSPNQMSTLRKVLLQDSDVVRPGIVHKEEKFVRPCVKNPENECDFGELKNPDFEKRAWKKQILRRVQYKMKASRNK
ncbi:hypothetical protein LOTGIDRAFT_229034 [Lottia gigantea]|uniref:Small ribosomal subunit protein bS6m n=1 Tax=Lottia gigantea TaxID=225164 RepID=V4A2E3_LOTGI|nr:hypothetical protein LOTGIDRAFT_229034 [Lottia gigantea]ESO89110.1 hypothetical protein LOTGIDRAFT_229034 [Lottia gigantea]